MIRNRPGPAIVAVAALFLTAPAAFAQGNQGAGGFAQGRASASTGSSPAVAQVGAGTVNGTTTGFSGPDQGGGGKPDITASLCDAFQGQAFHQDCLDKVLGTGAQQ